MGVRSWERESSIIGPIDHLTLIYGGVVMVLAGLLSGATGFGFALVSTPLLLAAGFPLPFVVPANLALALLTRLSIVYRLRAQITPRRAGLLVVGSIPGLVMGTQVLAMVDPALLKRVAGLLAIVAAIWLILGKGRARLRPMPGATFVAGLAGGFFGATTSLNGVPPALLLVSERLAPLRFVADLATYAVFSNLLALGILQTRGLLDGQPLLPAMLLWLPGALLGNTLGIYLVRRLSPRLFRGLALGVIVISGLVSLLAA